MEYTKTHMKLSSGHRYSNNVPITYTSKCEAANCLYSTDNYKFYSKFEDDMNNFFWPSFYQKRQQKMGTVFKVDERNLQFNFT